VTSRAWIVVGVLLFLLGTLLGFTVLQNNLNDNDSVTRKTCELALANRVSTHLLIQSVLKQPGLTAAEEASLRAHDRTLVAKILAAPDCNDV